MKIVLTGGPSAGKTSAVEVLHRMYASRTVVVPEAATILFRGGFPRKDRGEALKSQQKAIFAVQTELEQIASIENPQLALLCDRGSLDALAYWPANDSSFFEAIGSTMQEQVRRYDWVLHLDTTTTEDYQNASYRPENREQALEINSRVKAAWADHPQRIVVASRTSFLEKLNEVAWVVRDILGGQSYRSICDKQHSRN